ncbi:MAG: glycoside hydrolase domain-containing protein [Candidatus Sulfotelmatobacter sp.]
MRTKQVSLIFSLMLAICLCFTASAQQAGRIESMKLLTPYVGWAATNTKLFWTTEGGANWKDITPKSSHKHQNVSSVFFLDASTGWVLLKCSDDKDVVADQGCWVLASTTDAGGDWTTGQEKIVLPAFFTRGYLEQTTGFSGRSWLQFLDPQHGWALLDIATHAGVPSAGEMLRTTDGGKTWRPTKEVPMPDHFRFVTTTEGWIAGGDDGDLFVTRNGGDSWVKVETPDATGIGEHFGGDYGLPAFESEREGSVWVQYSTGPTEGPNQSALVLFVTNDGGGTWKQGRAMTALPAINHAQIVGGALVAAHSEIKQQDQADKACAERSVALLIVSMGPDQTRTTNEARLPIRDGAVLQLTFLSPETGWANISGRLFASRDAGKEWAEITPGGAPPQPPSVCVPVNLPRPATRNRSAVGGVSPAQPSSESNVSAHLGFDITRSPCPSGISKCSYSQSLTVMQAWMNSSPYYDTSVYLPGSPNRGTDQALTQAWVQGAVQQGWGLIPIWFGPQRPCACYYVKGQCTQFPTVYSSNPYSDGTTAADKAVSSAQALGLSTLVTYADVENYYVSGLCTAAQRKAAGQAVRSYVQGWVTGLHAMGYSSGAGVYANPVPIATDISVVSPKPDNIWIAQANGQVTIWNVGTSYGMTDSMWPNNQRIHQFLIDQAAVTWGGTPLQIDDDIDNAPIAYANNGSKDFSTYSTSSFSYPGSCVTYSYGINDVWGGAFINGSGETGQIVGEYLDCNYHAHSFLLDGIQYSNIDYPGSVWSAAYGINNLGQIVGTWEDANYCDHGFLLSGGTYTSIDNPNAVCPAGGFGGTSILGINDAGQMTGDYYLADVGSQSFVYYGPKFYPTTTFAGVCCTEANGINGDATIAGTYSNNGTQTGFWEPATPPTWAGTPDSYLDAAGAWTLGESINNNGDIGGYYEVSYEDDYALLFTDGVQLISFQYPPDYDTYGYGFNDFGQMVGYYSLPYGGGTYGYVATLQP